VGSFFKDSKEGKNSRKRLSTLDKLVDKPSEKLSPEKPTDKITERGEKSTPIVELSFESQSSLSEDSQAKPIESVETSKWNENDSENSQEIQNSASEHFLNVKKKAVDNRKSLKSPNNSRRIRF